MSWQTWSLKISRGYWIPKILIFYQKREQYKITRSGVTRKLPRQPQKSELPAKGIAEIALKSHTTTLGLIIARNSNVYFDTCIDLKHGTQEQPMQ